MKKLFILTRATLGSMFSSSVRSSKGKKIGTVIAFSVLGIYLAAFFGFLSFALYELLSPLGMQALIPAIAVIAGSMFSLLTAVISSNGFIYQPKDIQMLFSLPVSHTVVLISKFLSLYFYTLITDAVICLPTGIIYLVLDGGNALSYISLVLIMLFVPFIPLAGGCVISYIIGLLTSGMKHKNFALIAISALMFIAVMLVSQNSSDLTDYIVESADKIYDIITTWYYPASLACKALGGDILALLIFMGMGVLPFVIIFPIISRRYAFIVASGNQAHKNEKYVLTATKTKGSSFSACFKKELSKVFSSANYFTNSCTGILMLLVFAILFISKGSLGDDPEIDGMTIGYIAMIVTFVSVFASTIASTTSCTISLEAKTLWIYKTAPIATATVLKAKTAVNIILLGPATVIFGIVMSIYHGFSASDAMAMILLPLASVVYASMMGLILNLAKPKLDWANEIQAIKQSSSVVLSMLEGIGSTLLLGGMIILPVVLLEVPFYVAALAATAIIAIVCVFLAKIISGWGVRKFEQLF